MNDVLTPEEYQKLLALGAENTDLDAQILQQMQQARLMQAQAPQAQQYGRVVVPPNILNLLGSLAQQKSSMDWDKAATASQQQRTRNTSLQNSKILEAILRARTPGINPSAEPGGSGFMPPKPKSPFSLGGM